MTTLASRDPRVYAVEDGGRCAVRLGRPADAVGVALTLTVTTVADERDLSARIEDAPNTARFVPLLRVTAANDSHTGQDELGGVVTGWVRLEPDGETISCEALLLRESLRFHGSGRAAVHPAPDLLPDEWWGEGHATSRHWPSADCTVDDYVAAMVKILAELTRDAAEDLGELRRRLEALIASEIRQDPLDGTRTARTVELERSLAALIDVARIGTATRSRLRRAERELAWLWRDGPRHQAAYGRVRELHHASGLPRSDDAFEQSYLLAARQFARGAETLTEEISASYELLGGVGAFAAARDAAGQAQLNRIAGAAAVLATVIGSVLALYGADLAVPGMDARPWPLLAIVSAVIAALFAWMARASRSDDDRSWWTRAGVLSALASAGFVIAALVQAAPPTPQTQLQCSPVGGGDQVRCTGDAVVTTP